MYEELPEIIALQLGRPVELLSGYNELRDLCAHLPSIQENDLNKKYLCQLLVFIF